jgi:hypothetical protein
MKLKIIEKIGKDAESSGHRLIFGTFLVIFWMA